MCPFVPVLALVEEKKNRRIEPNTHMRNAGHIGQFLTSYIFLSAFFSLFQKDFEKRRGLHISSRRRNTSVNNSSMLLWFMKIFSSRVSQSFNFLQDRTYSFIRRTEARCGVCPGTRPKRQDFLKRKRSLYELTRLAGCETRISCPQSRHRNTIWRFVASDEIAPCTNGTEKRFTTGQQGLVERHTTWIEILSENAMNRNYNVAAGQEVSERCRHWCSERRPRA